MGGDRIRFSHILPVVDLALLVLLVFVPITMTALRLYEVAKGSDPIHLHTGQFETILRRDQIVPFAIQIATLPRARTMMAINLPGSLLQWVISLPSRSSPPSEWHPQAIALEAWQALVFPFFALPFWWLVGCGLDAIVSKERLDHSILVPCTLLFAICLALVLAFHFGMSASEQQGLIWAIRGAIGWTIAFAILPMAWIMQSISHRRSPPAAF